MTGIIELVVFGAGGPAALWLVFRCRLGFHADPILENDRKGTITWRCPRCMHEAGTSDSSPTDDIKPLALPEVRQSKAIRQPKQGAHILRARRR